MSIYDILEDFQFEFPTSELDAKWELFSAPKRCMECIQSQTQILDKQKEVFLKEMAREQEEFEEALDNIELTVGAFEQYQDMNKYEETFADVESVNARLKEIKDKANMYNRRENLMGKPVTDYSRLAKASKEFEPYSNLWTTTRNWHKDHKSWMEDPWEDLDAIVLEETVQNSFKTILKTLAYFKNKELPKIQDIAQTMKEKIGEFRKYVPLAVSLRKKGMYDRHWDQISEGVGFDIRPVEGFTLTTVIEKGLEDHVPLCEEVGEKAAREYNIECMLIKMKDYWVTDPTVKKFEDGLNANKFNTPTFKATNTFTIAGFDDAMNMLDEHIVNTQAIQFSPFRGPFEEEIEEWAAKLLLVSDTLEEWIKCQGQWMYLQPIFDSPDIVKQL
jgi:dynein heavy chain